MQLNMLNKTPAAKFDTR